ncbi:MAG: hypothetical protein ACK5P7_05635 [Bdellovibrio sp.]|jgi:hypothetical protein
MKNLFVLTTIWTAVFFISTRANAQCSYDFDADPSACDLGNNDQTPMAPALPAAANRTSELLVPLGGPNGTKGGLDERTQPTKASPVPRGTNVNASVSPAPSGVDEGHADTVREAIQACQTAAESTEGSCATDRNSTMGSVMTAGDQIARSMGSMTGSTIGETCAQMANYQGAANTALGAIKANCVSSFSQCSDSCKTADDLIKQLPSAQRYEFTSQLTPLKRQCNSAQERIRGIDQNIASAMQAYQRSQACLADVGTTMPTLAQCQANPSLPNCNLVLPQDCSNAQIAATNIACICQATNGRDPRCGSANFSSSLPNSGGTLDQASVNDGTLGAPSLDAFGTKSDYVAPEIKPTARGEMNLQGQGGGGGGGISGRGANEPKPRQPGYSPSRINADVNKGFIGGGAPGFGTKGGLAGGSVGPDAGWIPPKVAPNPNAINFDKFRPSDANFRNRGLASNDVLPSGLLAPHVNIWKQVNSRYLKIMSTLTP